MRILVVLALLGVAASSSACGEVAPLPEEDRSACVVVSSEGEVVGGTFVPRVTRYGCGGCVGRQRERDETEGAYGVCPSSW
jgi:hypothetical protein